MKTIHINKISLLNFKGLRSQEIMFTNGSTNIFGANGSGKTSIFDAFTWLLFGKDSTDRKDFEIKTLDGQNKPIEKIEHEVEAEIDIDGQVYNIKRVLKEKWVKKKGSTHTEFTGNETEYYWNGVPMQQKEFQNNVSQIMDEGLFKMITNTLAFNSLKWQDKRNTLMSMVSVSDQDIANGNDAYQSLLVEVKKHKNIEEYKKMILASVKKAKEDIKNIPTRIDEVSRSLPEEQDFRSIETRIQMDQAEILKIDDQIQDRTKAIDEVIKKRNDHALKISKVNGEISSIENQARMDALKQVTKDTSEIDTVKSKITYKKTEQETIKGQIARTMSQETSLKNQIENLDKTIASKRGEWNEENSKELVFNDNQFCCPACKREFEAADIDVKKAELSSNFQKDKQEKLSQIQEKGKSLAADKLNAETELNNVIASLKTLNQRKHEAEAEINEMEAQVVKWNSENTLKDTSKEEKIYESILEMNVEYKAKKQEKTELEKIVIEVPTADNSDLKEKRKELSDNIDKLKITMSDEEQIKKGKERILALQKEESDLAQQIADVEKIEYTIDQFTKAKMDKIESLINAKFKFVKFKMFDQQINGGEVECCEALINGVPFSDANTASKINAGLDIINTLTNHYQVSAPIFIDNKESVTEIIPTVSQVISLIVSPEDKKLRVA